VVDNPTSLIIFVIAAGLAFDFVNGFHDASNSIATIVATKVLKPKQAVLWAAFFNVAAAFVFGTGVAQTVGAGLVTLELVTPVVILCGLVGSTLWGIITWRLGLPTSSSHALLGGYAGSAMANCALYNGWEALWAPIIWSGWIKVIAFIFLAPVIGLILGYGLMTALLFLQRRYKVSSEAAVYKKLQLASSAFLSLMHGSNDAQKTAGIIAGALTSAGILSSFSIPQWVLAVSYGMMGLGTLVGGWRIVHTMGYRLTKLSAQGGVCAEGAAALSILSATLFDLPISTTHATTGAIMGVGAAAGKSGKVQWPIGGRIAIAWLLTIPAAAFVGASMMTIAFMIGR
jgi:PiT family inorganic phosphate transporter